MKVELSEKQKSDLANIWRLCRGEESLITNMLIPELEYFLETCPELITDSHKKIETQEGHNYMETAKNLKKAIDNLKKIPQIDRLNKLSVRQSHTDIANGKHLPIHDPLDYVETIRDNALKMGDTLLQYTKYERQLDMLKDFLPRFTPFKNIKRVHFFKISCALWPSVDPESFEKHYHLKGKTRGKTRKKT